MVRACVPRQAPGAELKVLSALNLTKIDLMGYYTKMRGLGYETDKRGLLVARSLAETINVDDEQDPIRELIELERRIPVKIGVDTSLRAKIIDSCGMTCVFCHNEGTPVASAYDKNTSLPLPRYRGGRVSIFENTNGVNFLPGKMNPDTDFMAVIIQMRDLLDCRELHLTGGEPTLHPELSGIVKIATEAGYKVKITSNGENGARHMKLLADAGVSKINFSIFGTTPEELSRVQHTKFNDIKLAQRKLDALHESISSALKNNIKVDANIVMSEFSHAERVARIIDEYGSNVSIRILNDLEAGSESYIAIYKFLSEIGARPKELSVEAGSSNSRVEYQLPDGGSIYFKQIRRTILPKTCESCSLNNAEDCLEGYYGMRLYRDLREGNYKVGVCIQRMDLTEDIDKFLQGGICQEIIDLRNNEESALRALYRESIRE